MLRPEKPVIAISIGDYNGIGPEIILKSLSGYNLAGSTPVIISPPDVVEHALQLLKQDLDIQYIEQFEDINPDRINVLTLGMDDLGITTGSQSRSSGLVSMRSIETSLKLCMEEKTHAMVTAPISKEAVNLAGYQIPGHTEFLAEQTGTDDVLMMLVSGDLRVSLVTTHIPVNQVSKAVTIEAIQSKADILSKSLVSDFGIESPKVAILGLNPHAGDGGVIGKEEMITGVDPAKL